MCLDNIQQRTPDAFIVVVDDASKVPVRVPDGVELFRFERNVGIARAKNKCLELLMAHGCEELFLFDDDCWPNDYYWYQPYVDSPEPHLCYLFRNRALGRSGVNQARIIYDDGKIWAISPWPQGCMMYLNRSVIERVGGYRPEFGKWGYEHAEFSERIHAAGLTTNKYQDVCQRNKIYSADESGGGGTFTRSVPTRVRVDELYKGKEVYEKYSGSTDYVEYRGLPNLVITSLLTEVVDPQRKTKWVAAGGLVEKWAESLRGCEFAVLFDSPDLPENEIWHRAASGANPYIQRWVNTYQYLREHPANWVWVTDGTDVEMLREPWTEMEHGKLYIGYEPQVVGCNWLAQHHAPYREWIDSHGGLQLLNAGVVGGDHDIVMEFAHDVATEGLEVDHSTLAGDMAALNKVLRQPKWEGRWFTGPLVVTVFKANERNTWSWWKHK